MLRWIGGVIGLLLIAWGVLLITGGGLLVRDDPLCGTVELKDAACTYLTGSGLQTAYRYGVEYCPKISDGVDYGAYNPAKSSCHR
ncbi:hypothetical protein [Parvibaculum sp. MBR-TMA-1.3b-4.2]|jgi:hypothetical protein